MTRKITNLVFQGGSVKGAAYVGAIDALEENGVDMAAIKRVAGASAGAITACALALGCDAKMVKELLKKFDFKEVLDDAEGSIHTQSKVLKSVEKHTEGTSLFFSKVPVKPILPVLAYRMSTQSGIYEGKYMLDWIENLIQTQVSQITEGKHSGKYLTFEELHQLTLDYPGKFRELAVLGSNFTTGKKLLFCNENSDTKNVIISDAIRISMSIPQVFKPHHIYYKKDNERFVEATRDIWVDGGVYDNYPIDSFDAPQYMESGELCVSEDGKRFYNPETLGFRLVSKETKDYFEGIGEEPKKSLNGLFEYVTEIAQLGGDIQEQIYALPENIKRTVYIDHKNISTLAFNLTEAQEQELVLSGKEATQGYLVNNSDNICDIFNS